MSHKNAIKRREAPITAIVILYYSKSLLPSFLDNIIKKIAGLNEIILVDNSNEDLTEFESPMVKVVYPLINVGYGAAINIGIERAKNEIIVILNPDITIKRWGLPEEISEIDHFFLSSKPEEWPCMRKFPSIGYDFFRYALGNLGWPFGWVRDQYGRIPVDHKHSMQRVDWVSGSLIITNKATMVELGGFDEKYFLFYEEVDLCKRASLLSIPSCITPMIVFLNNQGTSSSTDVNEIKFTSSIQSFQRYHSKYTGEYISFCFFKMLKFCCWVIASLLGLFNRCKKYQKSIAKERQYRIYYQNIR